MTPINLSDYEKLAEERIEPGAWGFFQGGSDDEVTLRECRAAFQRIKLRPRMLVDVRTIDMHTTVLGTPISLPVLVAPTAYHCLAHPEGECATVQGVGSSATIMIASSFSNRSLEEIASVATKPLWFQLYSYRDLQSTGKVIQRAEAAGYKALVLTADLPRLGNRERDIRSKFVMPPHLFIANYKDVEKDDDYIPVPTYLTWDAIGWLRGLSTLPIVVKGILTAEDALIALERGADAIAVSNHGGRQLDGEIPSIEALPEIIEAVDGRCEVYVDGGIRRGTDILKALALGARAVFIGRPAIWGLAVNGAEGVHSVLDILRTELELAMALSGCTSLDKITRSLVRI
ncbi:MAG TPA: alpha-hydroxy acid oxidase [Ktedonobacteraceae bacterium]|nr:alpha-hydroxy acid oxidase [Ktedonobacteraceae bacterium]